MSRPSTPPRDNGNGSTTVTVKRHCNGCSRDLGDATDAELDAAVAGRPLPDVTAECGCDQEHQHDFRFWGDDPYLKCSECGEIQDALTGRVIQVGTV